MDEQLVPKKTAKGCEEIAQRTHGLPMRARRALILVDGHRSVAALAAGTADDGLRETLAQLLADGFIEAAAPASAVPDQSGTAAPPPEEAQLCATLKEFMIIQLRAIVVGWRALDMVDRINRCHSLDDLRGEVAAWHAMIVRARDGGPQKADALLASLRRYLPA